MDRAAAITPNAASAVQPVTAARPHPTQLESTLPLVAVTNLAELASPIACALSGSVTSDSAASTATQQVNGSRKSAYARAPTRTAAPPLLCSVEQEVTAPSARRTARTPALSTSASSSAGNIDEAAEQRGFAARLFIRLVNGVAGQPAVQLSGSFAAEDETRQSAPPVPPAAAGASASMLQIRKPALSASPAIAELDAQPALSLTLSHAVRTAAFSDAASDPAFSDAERERVTRNMSVEKMRAIHAAEDRGNTGSGIDAQLLRIARANIAEEVVRRAQNPSSGDTAKYFEFQKFRAWMLQPAIDALAGRNVAPDLQKDPTIQAIIAQAQSTLR